MCVKGTSKNYILKYIDVPTADLIYDRYAFNACFYYFLEQIKQASK
jgi:hypothetical protein